MSSDTSIYHSAEAIGPIPRMSLLCLASPSPSFLHPLCIWNTRCVCSLKNTLFGFAYVGLSVRSYHSTLTLYAFLCNYIFMQHFVSEVHPHGLIPFWSLYSILLSDYTRMNLSILLLIDIWIVWTLGVSKIVAMSILVHDPVQLCQVFEIDYGRVNLIECQVFHS